jgi:hypothetical protein
MLRRLTALAAPLVVLLSATGGHASIILSANLTNSQENPPTNPTNSLTGAPRTSFGTASFVMDDARTFMTFTATITGIDFTGNQSADTNDNLIAAHIHAAAVVTPTTNAPVVWGFFGSPFNDNNPNDVVITPLASGVGGTISGKWDLPEGNNTTLSAQIPNILSGNSYINFHTNQFTGGEIRGAIVLLATPEPASLAMGATAALAGLGAWWCRRKRAAA